MSGRALNFNRVIRRAALFGRMVWRPDSSCAAASFMFWQGVTIRARRSAPRRCRRGWSPLRRGLRVAGRDEAAQQIEALALDALTTVGRPSNQGGASTAAWSGLRPRARRNFRHTNSGQGTGMRKRPPRRRYPACCASTSSRQVHAKRSTTSGWRSPMASGARTGIPTPGRNLPCL